MKIDEVLEEVIISSPDKTIIEEIVDIVDKSGNEEFESEIIEIKTPLTSETVCKNNSVFKPTGRYMYFAFGIGSTFVV